MSISWYNGFSPEKRLAVGRWQKEEMAAGRLPYPKRCVVCRQTEGSLHAHLEDYDKPADYITLCYTCHILLHCRFRRTLLFNHYRSRVGRGWQAPPVSERDGWRVVCSTFLANDWPSGSWPNGQLSVPRTTFLDELPMARQQRPPVLV